MQILGQPMSSKIKSSLREISVGLFCFAAGLCAHGQAGNPVQGIHSVPPVSVSQRGPGNGASPTTASAATTAPAAAVTDGRASDAAAKPATVVLHEGELKIDTDNSDLSQILRDVARVSGMTVDGNVKSIRVFGVYGPGNPGDVLTDLLAGSGYNFMMVGKLGDGAPRELLLSEKNGRLPSAGAGPNAAASSDDDDANTPDEDAPGPGAVTNVPPPPSQDPQERMQQNMQRLQQQREQMQQQQQQQNPPQ